MDHYMDYVLILSQASHDFFVERSAYNLFVKVGGSVDMLTC